jgi:hypothetical protein
MINITESFQLHYYELKRIKDTIDRDIDSFRGIINDEVNEIKLLNIQDRDRLDWVGQASQALMSIMIIRDDVNAKLNERKYQLN